jgi:hypothetical protein
MELLGNRLRSRFGVATLLATGAAVLLAAPPALAEPAGADVQFRVAGNKVVELASKPFFVQLYNDGPASAENIVVKVDLGGLDTNKLGIQPATGCDEDGTIYTCSLGSLVPGEFNNGFSPFDVTSLEEGATGPAGSFTVEVTSDTPDPKADNNKKVTVPVEVAPLAYDLVTIVEDVWDGTIGQRVAPGATMPLLFDVINLGALTAEHLVWKVSLPPYVTFAKDEKHDGCTYNKERTEATCELPDAQLHPFGTLSYYLGDPMLVTVAKDAPGPGALVGGIVAAGARRTEAPVSELAAAQATAKNAKDVKVANATTDQKQKAAAANGENNGGNDADNSDNDGAFSVHTAANPADLQVFAGSGSGALGSTVSIPVKVKNDGPASSPFTTLTVTAPTGTELVDVPTGCEFTTAGKVAKCEGVLAAHESETGAFAFKIASTTIANDGKATISGTLEDPHPGNNTAAIVITIGSGGGLPITGTKVSVIGGTGTAVLVAGVALFLFARRRRVVLVTPAEDR